MGVKNRENMRFARTRIFGLLREILREIGVDFAHENVLDEADDIFYLTIDEVWDFVKGTAVTTDLRGLAHLRQAEFEGYRQETTTPDDRFNTYGMAYHRNLFQNHNAETAQSTDGMLRGIGCCPGVVTGSVKVLCDPTNHVNLSGEILVAERTDPGWVPLFPAVSGILVERGSFFRTLPSWLARWVFPRLSDQRPDQHAQHRPKSKNGRPGRHVGNPIQSDDFINRRAAIEAGQVTRKKLLRQLSQGRDTVGMCRAL